MDRKHRQSGSLGYFTDYRVSGKADGMAVYRRPTFQVAEPCGSLQLREARARGDAARRRAVTPSSAASAKGSWVSRVAPPISARAMPTVAPVLASDRGPGADRK